MLGRAAGLLVWCGYLCTVMPAAGSEGIWLDVPFVKQPKDGCGAASIAMVMQYWLKQQGRPINGSAEATEIQRILYAPEARGIHASAMQLYFRQNGFSAFSFSGEWNDVEQHLQRGRPLIVALDASAGAAASHYVVIVGFDRVRRMLLLNDPARRKLLKQDRADFEKQWKASGNWTLLALPQPANQS